MRALGTDKSSLPQADPGRNHRDTLKDLLPYLWPAGEPELRLRVVLARSLRQLTGQALGPEFGPWNAWRRREAAVAAGEEPPTPYATPSGALPRYRGLDLASDRVVFVLDVSGSMGWSVGASRPAAVAGRAGRTTARASRQRTRRELDMTGPPRGGQRGESGGAEHRQVDGARSHTSRTCGRAWAS